MQEIKLDLSIKKIIDLVHAKQRDVGTKILVKLTDNKEEYTIPDGVTWSVWYAGASGEGNYTEINGRSAVVVEGSTATVELIYQMLNNPGGGQMCLVMNGPDNTQLGLWNIPYFVEAIPGADSQAAIAYYQAFLNAQAKAEEAAGRAEAAAEQIEVDQEFIATQVFAAGGSAEAAAGAAHDAAESEQKAKENADRAEEALRRAEEVADTNRHAGYFVITEDGVLSLKEEYRGAPAKNTYPDAVSDKGVGVAGSLNAELPKHLVIPEIVDFGGVVGEVAVSRIADGAFYGNNAIKSVTLPKTIKDIPVYCFRDTYNLEKAYNTEHFTSVGNNAFMNSGITSVNFPNLITMGTSAFCQCWRMTHANIGKVTEIPTDAFYKCRFLSRIDSECNITSAGDTALWSTNRLVNADFVKNLKKIGKGAFACSGVDFDWASLGLPNDAFGNNATALQINPIDFWSACTPIACENPLPTLLCQSDPRWKSKPIGNSGVIWELGCQLFCIMHAYSGLNNIPFETVAEFEEEVEKVAPGLLDTYTKRIQDVREFVSHIGITVTDYYEFNQTNLQALYDALADGKYACIATSVDDAMYGHVILAYGVTSSGKIMFADSDYLDRADRTKGGVTYPLFYKVAAAVDAYGTAQVPVFCILEKTQ